MKTLFVFCFMFAFAACSKKSEPVSVPPPAMTKVEQVDSAIKQSPSPKERAEINQTFPRTAKDNEEAEEPSRHEESTQIEIRQAIKNAPDLVKRWREYQSSDAKALLQEYLLEYQIKPATLGLDKAEVQDLLKDGQD